ncbi:T9SS type A sorting domain-containing protein [Hymenobacter sp. BT664]|uniref:T9SS type A sorting domain-containing protein n=1 Tax=Hymenobacter montanus TaxID=2771359 RepID=A0A927BE88_9BACT|nr:T9SS type A sorting domain-containing protein [Hymenobacter montanus]MBD2769235.1 T9SS type A sorting domain-containing protein [Hymenobacter montanus]
MPAHSPSVLRRVVLLLVVVLLSQFSARADTDFYKDFIVLRSGPTTTYYYTYAGTPVPNPPFQNANLGEFAPDATGVLMLDGAEANINEEGTALGAVWLFYRVYEEGTVPGAFVQKSLVYRPPGPDDNPYTKSRADAKKWVLTDAGIDLVRVAGRGGRFVLEVYFGAAGANTSGTRFSRFDDNRGANYRATFTVGQGVQPYASPSNAEVDGNFHAYVGQVFGGLEPNRVPTGLLADYGFEFANPRIYNGSLLEDSTLVDQTTYADLYNTLYTSQFNAAAAGMRHPGVHDSLCYAARQREVITLSGLLFNYNAIDPQAQVNGTIQTINEQFRDQYTDGVWQNPYQELTTVAISPSTSYYNLTSCQVVLPSSLFLSNIANQISTVTLDADDGQGFRPIRFDTPLALNYATTGWKHWLFRVTLTNGQQLLSHSKLHIDNTSNIVSSPDGSRSGGPNGTAARGFVVDERRTIWATEPYLGHFGAADVVISYRNAGDPVLRRPLIIAEGFDPGHILSPEEPEGDNTFRSFITRAQTSGSAALRSLISDDPNQYDIVYVNWRNGTDYLQRNALVLEAVIRWVNANKQPFGTTLQPNVVLGSSMGGVIARMALGRMDRAGGVAAHQTRLYVSVDAPHLGANVPLGYQAAARHATRMYLRTGPIAAAIEVIQLLGNGPSPLRSLLLADQPASKQILINRLDLRDQLANSPHIQFQEELRTSWAYPVNIRNVAISNGSECGIDQEFTPGSSLLYHYRSVKTRFLSDLIGMAAGIGLGALGVPFYLTAPLVIPGSSKFELTLDIKALADGGGNRVYYGNIRYTKKILWLVPVRINIVNHSYTAPSGLLPLDTYPGGFYTVKLDGLPSASSQDWAFYYNNNFFIQRRFGFIPTVSALDIGQGNSALGAGDYLARYVGGTPPAAPLNSPFANFTTGFNLTGTTYPFDNSNWRVLNNEPHESFSLRSGDWLAAELNSAPTQTNCAAACGNNSYSIVGNAAICTTSDYRISNLPAGTVVTWSISPNAQSALQLAPNVPSPNELRITNQNAGPLTTTLTATINSCGRTITITKQVSAYTITSLPVPSGFVDVEFVTCDDAPALPIIFYPDSPFGGVITLTPSVLHHTLQSQRRPINVRYTNPCTGEYTSKVMILDYRAPYCGYRTANANSFYTISPNPSSDIVHIDLSDPNSQPAKGTIISGELFNMMGQSKARINVLNNRATFSVRALEKGIYVLKIYIADQVESHQIAVE